MVYCRSYFVFPTCWENCNWSGRFNKVDKKLHYWVEIFSFSGWSKMTVIEVAGAVAVFIVKRTHNFSNLLSSPMYISALKTFLAKAEPTQYNEKIWSMFDTTYGNKVIWYACRSIPIVNIDLLFMRFCCHLSSKTFTCTLFDFDYIFEYPYFIFLQSNLAPSNVLDYPEPRTCTYSGSSFL